MKATTKQIYVLKERLREISYLGSTLGVLDWDREVHMPAKAVDARAASISYISGLVHEKSIHINDDSLLSHLKKLAEAKKLPPEDAVLVLETWRTFEREQKLPLSFVRELSETIAKSHHHWAEARQKNDFSLFKPWLEKIVALTRKEAQLVGFTESPYDALLDMYEPNMTTKEAYVILEELKDFLVPFLKKIRQSSVFKHKTIDKNKFKGIFPESKQIAFTHIIAHKMGFDMGAGKIEKSTHPFTTSFSPLDVRFTTRYNEHDFFESIGATIHETGHALYEQGLLPEHFGTPLGEAISLGIHESQSRMWENAIGKSKEFWMYFYPQLQKEFPHPFKKIPLDVFYKTLNEVKPSFIRIEADEVTYNLHIILRFELEKALIEGTIDVEDLPAYWNEKMKEYFGITVRKDSLGVLQDVHWSSGLFGYFPTYSFGNLYAAQFYSTMEKEIPHMHKKIASGNLLPIREWLRSKIHVHGKMHTAGELVEKVTGEPLSSRYFKEYIERKYSEIYQLER